jgi:hypothetical protein
MWEDPANAGGGKWVLTMKNNPELLDRCWSWMAMALVGEELEDGDEICGAVVSLRTRVDRIQLWTRSKDDVEKLNSIGKKMVKLLDVSEADQIGLEFQVRIFLSFCLFLNTNSAHSTIPKIGPRLISSSQSSRCLSPASDLPSNLQHPQAQGYPVAFLVSLRATSQGVPLPPLVPSVWAP